MPFFKFVSPKQAKEGKRIVKTPVTIRTSVPIATVLKALDQHVSAAPDVSSLRAIEASVYVSSRNDTQIVYACGNRVNHGMFVSIALFKREGETTVGEFHIARHLETNGTVNNLDYMVPLRDQVIEAFRSVDPSAVVTE